MAIQSEGNVHAQFREITREQYVSLTKDKRIASVGICDAEEKVTGVRLLNDKEDRFRTGNIDHVDKNYLSMRVISDYDGVRLMVIRSAFIVMMRLKDFHILAVITSRKSSLRLSRRKPVQ